MLAILFEGPLADVGIPLPFQAIVERLGVVNQTLISSFVAIGDKNGGGGENPNKSSQPLESP